MILVVLQCAWFADGKERSETQWKEGLKRSHTGRRLSYLLPLEVPYKVINASPQIGNYSGAAFPPDLEHIQKEIDEYKPKIIVGCGRIAQKGLKELGIRHIQIPHPAWRQLTNRQLDAARITIMEELGNE